MFNILLCKVGLDQLHLFVGRATQHDKPEIKVNVGCIWNCTLPYYEWQRSHAIDTGRSHDNDNMMNIVHLDYIHIISTKLKEYAILDAA